MDSKTTRYKKYVCENLHNTDYKKTRTVIEYITGLKAPRSSVQFRLFTRRVQDALKLGSANAMLESIGYVNQYERPRIYAEVEERAKEFLQKSERKSDSTASNTATEVSA